MPMCGFSNSVIQILNHYGVDYKDVNVLTDPMIREKFSEHSGWPQTGSWSMQTADYPLPLA